MQITHKAIISPCRSASTALENCFGQDPELRVIHQPIKSGLLRWGIEDYRIFFKKPLGARAIIFKETIGSRKLRTSRLIVFPSKELVSNTDQVFIFREPLETWRSWLKYNYKNLDFFLISYKHTFHLLKESLEIAPQRVTCITQDLFLDYPEQVLRELCSKWEIPYRENMLWWERPFGSDTCLIEFSKFTKIAIHKRRVFDSLKKAETVIRTQPQQDLHPTNEQEFEVVRQLAPIYQTVCSLSF